MMSTSTLCRASNVELPHTQDRQSLERCGSPHAASVWRFLAHRLGHDTAGVRRNTSASEPVLPAKHTSSLRDFPHWLASFAVRKTNANTARPVVNSKETRNRSPSSAPATPYVAPLTTASAQRDVLRTSTGTAPSEHSLKMELVTNVFNDKNENVVNVSDVPTSMSVESGKNDTNRSSSNGESAGTAAEKTAKMLTSGVATVTGDCNTRNDAVTLEPENTAGMTVAESNSRRAKKKVHFGDALQITICYYESESARRSCFWHSVRNAVHLTGKGRSVHPRLASSLRLQGAAGVSNRSTVPYLSRVNGNFTPHVGFEKRVVPFEELDQKELQHQKAVEENVVFPNGGFENNKSSKAKSSLELKSAERIKRCQSQTTRFIGSPLGIRSKALQSKTPSSHQSKS